MDMSSEEKLFDELKGLRSDFSKLDTKVEVLISREQPSAPCRKEIDRKFHDLDNKIIGFQGGINHSMKEIASQVDVNMARNISKSTFYWVVTGSFAFPIILITLLKIFG
jgi:hypothetical protein